MRIRLLLPLFLLPALTLAACGDDDDAAPAEATATPAATATTGPYGPAPVLGDNIIEVSPVHASTVTQESTRSPNPLEPSGVCAKVVFEGLPQYAQWFRMAVDGTEVTTSLTWIIATRDNPKDGTVCYAPTEGLTAGRHTAAISVQDPSNPAAPTRQLVAWSFDVEG